MNKCFKIVLLCTCLFYKSISQNTPQAHDKKAVPGVAFEFLKYGSIPVNEYRGLVDISIPLLNIIEDDINIPIELKYYTGGIRVNEDGGIVGLGWSLNMPTIVQQIKSKNDFSFATRHQQLPPVQGNPALPGPPLTVSPWYGSLTLGLLNNYNPLPDIRDIPYYKNVTDNQIIDHNGFYNTSVGVTSKFEKMFGSQLIDTEPDIFTLYLNNVVVQFYRQQANNPFEVNTYTLIPVNIVNGRNEFKIEVIPAPSPPANINDMAILGIKVTDPSENVYFFEKLDVTNVASYDSNIMYKMTKITTNKNKEIKFNYGTRINYAECEKRESFFVDYIGQQPTNTIYQSPHGDVDKTYNNVQGKNIYINHFQSYYPLESIETTTCNINFLYENRDDVLNFIKLKTIQQKNIFNRVVKKFDLEYDYFNSAEPYTKRLKLMAVKEDGSAPYRMEYNTLQLPSKKSNSIDYWGFYNGQNNQDLHINLTEFGYPPSNGNGNNFNSNLDYAQASSLYKIIYPTKGYTKFEYELHSFDNLIFHTGGGTKVINFGGGLRVKSVTNWKFDNTLAKKISFDYYGGKVINKRILTKDFANTLMYESLTLGNEFRTYAAVLSSINNFINSSGCDNLDYIGYDKVVKTEIGTESAGRTESNFSNTLSNCHNPVTANNTIPMYFNDRNTIENGKLITKNIYRESGELVLNQQFSYFNKIGGLNQYGMSLQSNGIRYFYVTVPYTGWSGNTIYGYKYFHPITLATFYPIIGKTTFLNSESTTEYINGVPKTINKKYGYDIRNNVVTTSTVEESALFKNRNVQSQKLSYSGNNNISYVEIKMNNELNEIQKNDFVYATNGVEQLKKSTVFPNGNLLLNNKNIYYDLYDDKENLIQYHSENGIYTCLIWGYKKTLPIAKIENIQYTQIQNHVAQLQDLSNIDNELNLIHALTVFRNTLNTQFPNISITTYTHVPLVGASSITDVKGDIIKYKYDDYGKLINVKDKNGNILKENEYHFKL